MREVGKEGMGGRRDGEGEERERVRTGVSE